MVSYLHCSRSCRRVCPRTRPWIFKKYYVRVKIRIKSVFCPCEKNTYRVLKKYGRASRNPCFAPCEIVNLLGFYPQSFGTSTKSRIGYGTSGVTCMPPGYPLRYTAPTGRRFSLTTRSYSVSVKRYYRYLASNDNLGKRLSYVALGGLGVKGASAWCK